MAPRCCDGARCDNNYGASRTSAMGPETVRRSPAAKHRASQPERLVANSASTSESWARPAMRGR
eukprot:8547006-Alexandrium_andersonii.AAC.1